VHSPCALFTTSELGPRYEASERGKEEQSDFILALAPVKWVQAMHTSSRQFGRDGN
jgi:hypothetical protein